MPRAAPIFPRYLSEHRATLDHRSLIDAVSVTIDTLPIQLFDPFRRSVERAFTVYLDLAGA